LTKNILFISSYTGLGGGETATLNLATHLEGYNVHLLVPAEGEFSRAWENAGGTVHVDRWRGATVYFVPAVWSWLPISHRIEKLIREQQIDIVHSDYHTLPMALPAAKRAGVPCVWTCMGWWFHPKWWQKSFFHDIDLIFAHSAAIKQGFLGTPPFMPADNIEVLYPGVDTTRFSPRVDGAALRDELGIGECPTVVIVARFQDVKGHDTFIRAAWMIKRRIPDTLFIIAGENVQSGADSAYKKRILAMVDNESYSRDHFHFIGHRADVERILAAADVVVCSSHFEGFGMVNVEAMASGKAVVSTNNGGPAEVVVDGVTGYLVPPKDPEAIANRVIELLYSETTRRSFGMAGRLRVQQIFSVDAVAERFDERVQSLL